MPKDKSQTRTQSRRAASKEALKQMQLLLGDERKVEVSSDDDVIEVDPQPPKKKYKLSHRKSSDGNDRDVIVLKTVTNASLESAFDLECETEELTPAQRARKDLANKEEKEIEAKIEQLARAPNTEVIYNGVCSTAMEITEQIQNIINAVQQAVPGQSIVLQPQPGGANSAMPQSYQLVMDPRLGVIVGAVTTPNPSLNAPPLQLFQSKAPMSAPSTITQTTPEPPAKARRGAGVTRVGASPLSQIKSMVQQKTTPAQTKLNTISNKSGIQVKPSLGKPMQVKQTPIKPQNQSKVNIVPTKARVTNPTNLRPTENNVEGGLSMGKTPTKSIVDLTNEDGRPLPDSREVSFNKLQGRTYPSLVVVARPHLRVKDLAIDRGKLDVKVKGVLMFPPTKFTEWLIQQGLVRSDQKCTTHTNNALKLGMYSDASKFPYSGGYVWISECCPQRFVSVFSGSLFEGSQHPPMAILKLLYHWCCQTIVQNVTQWVKVDNLYVKGMYALLRSVCTVGLQTHVRQLGGPGVKVQVGVISLGTTSQDGNQRQVKVEVLGILETSTKYIRLRAVEPLTDGEKNYKKRFSKILEPVFNWVHPGSVIVTDLTVDKSTLHNMGFSNVCQTTSTDYNNSNRTIMEYLRRIVPRMFQNTLSLLSRQIIQQFLDELVWREWYGTTVLQCFDNMIQHLSEQTRNDMGLSLIVRLNKVSYNPFKNWSISLPNSTPKVTEHSAPKRYSRGRKPATPQPPVPVLQDPAPRPKVVVNQELTRPTKSTSPDVPEQMVPLENYYYGTINTLSSTKPRVTLNIKCSFCKWTFNNNIALMNHLFKHAHNVSNDVQLCKYCLMIVPTGNDLLKHISTAHPDETKFDSGFVCLICEVRFKNPFILGKHMSKEHCPSELPYMCGTCNFRSSNHKQAVDHFYQQHEYGTTIQCPFCLKSTTIYSGTRNIVQNMHFFIQHLQKHQKKQLAKRCGRCNLWFVQKEMLREHQNKMHISQRGKLGLIPSIAPRNGVMVPKSRMDKCPDDAKIINFSTLYFNVSDSLLCKECTKLLCTPKHFGSFESCQNPNCQYSTCCSNSMQEHVSKCKFLNDKLPPEKLPYEMYCVCGYKDVYGNMMAKHLAICERKSAYPSSETAKIATVTHSMLDVLGLVRKPDETPLAVESKGPIEISDLVTVDRVVVKGRGRPRKNPEKISQPAPSTSKEKDKEAAVVVELDSDDEPVQKLIKKNDDEVADNQFDTSNAEKAIEQISKIVTDDSREATDGNIETTDFNLAETSENIEEDFQEFKTEEIDSEVTDETKSPSEDPTETVVESLKLDKPSENLKNAEVSTIITTEKSEDATLVPESSDPAISPFSENEDMNNEEEQENHGSKLTDVSEASKTNSEFHDVATKGSVNNEVTSTIIDQHHNPTGDDVSSLNDSPSSPNGDSLAVEDSITVNEASLAVLHEQAMAVGNERVLPVNAELLDSVNLKLNTSGSGKDVNAVEDNLAIEKGGDSEIDKDACHMDTD